MLIKPAYVGMCILHLKALMYEFNYDYNKKILLELKTTIHWHWKIDVWKKLKKAFMNILKDEEKG